MALLKMLINVIFFAGNTKNLTSKKSNLEPFTVIRSTYRIFNSFLFIFLFNFVFDCSKMCSKAAEASSSCSLEVIHFTRNYFLFFYPNKTLADLQLRGNRAMCFLLYVAIVRKTLFPFILLI